jgi:hypothetical protein
VSEEKPKVDLSVVQVVASALAAVSSAVLLSTVGVAGTLIGAAVGSVIATVAGAVYTYSLQASRERVAAAAQIAAMARSNLTRRSEGGAQDTQQVTARPEAAPGDADRPAWRTALAGLNWKRVAALAAGVFLAAMVAIVAFELVAGRPVSTYTGGTSKDSSSRTTLGGGSSEKSKQEPSSDGSATPSDDATADSSDEATPSEEPSEETSEEVTPSAEPTPEEEIPSEEPAAEPTEAATPTPAG